MSVKMAIYKWVIVLTLNRWRKATWNGLPWCLIRWITIVHPLGLVSSNYFCRRFSLTILRVLLRTNFWKSMKNDKLQCVCKYNSMYLPLKMKSETINKILIFSWGFGSDYEATILLRRFYMESVTLDLANY